MHPDQRIEYSRLKLAKLWHLCRGMRRNNLYAHEKINKAIVEDDFDVNCKVTIIDPHSSKSKNNFQDCTALHIVARYYYDTMPFNILLDRGADYTIKNGNGQTVLHLKVSDCCIDERNVHSVHRYNSVFINLILSAHVKYENSTNPQDGNGISHLHGACITNHVESLKLFLDNCASVDQAVNLKSPYFPGYTALHFAVLFNSFEAIQILLSYGANVNAKNSKGMTPLDICVKYRLDELTKLANLSAKDTKGVNDRKMQINQNENITKQLLAKNCPFTENISIFQLACTFKDLTIAESLLTQIRDINHAVSMESKIYPGYTVAHFAALKSVDALKMILAHGARVDIEDVEGLTPLDICLKKYSVQDVHDILSCVQDWKDILLSDGRTKLLDIAVSMRDVSQFALFLQNNIQDLAIPNDSPLWPGSTILHLGVIFSKKNIDDSLGSYHETLVRECLKYGPDVNYKNSKGQTPIQLAFRLNKYNIVRLLLERLNELDELENHIEEDDLSYLYIACAEGSAALVKKLLRVSEPNIVYKGKKISDSVVTGSTPLHAAVVNGSNLIAEMLLRHGANLHATDIYGFTPIHWLLRFYVRTSRLHPATANVLLNSLLEDPKDQVVHGLGLSYLHVACFFDNEQAAEKLLELGSDVKAAINWKAKSSPSFMHYYSKFTALHCVPWRTEFNVLDSLLRRGGADLFVKFFELPEHYRILRDDAFEDVIHHFMLILWDDDEIQKCTEKRLGITKLHVACYMKNEEAVRSVLHDGIDVDVQIHADSVIFAGCTALHLLMIMLQGDGRMGQLDIEKMIKLLLDHEADVTLANADNDTIIHLLCKYWRWYTDGNRCKDLLLNAQSDISVNPVNSEGWSHLHVACYFYEAKVVGKFLEYGSVDINRPTDFFAKESPGSTPLHLALNQEPWMVHNDNDWTKLTETVDLLLKRGVNVTAEDVYGDTALHQPATLRSPKMSIFEKLVSCGADMNRKNVVGLTPLVMLSNDNWPGYAKICQKYNCQANKWNRLTGEGHIGVLLSNLYVNVAESTKFEKLLQSADIRIVDEMGRTAIHNSVAVVKPYSEKVKNFIYVVDNLINQGIDIDHQDKYGRTALHYAAIMQNAAGTDALLACGADINIVDNDGKSAFTYAMIDVNDDDNELLFSLRRSLIVCLNLHVKKLRRLGLDVSQINQHLAKYIQKIVVEALDRRPHIENPIVLSQKFFCQIQLSKTMNVGVRSLTIFNFLSEIGAVTLYPYLHISERTIIDDFFKSKDFNELEQLVGIIKLQFRKTKARTALIEPAVSSLRSLLGFSFAGLCEEITTFLTNDDLNNLIASMKIEGDDMDRLEITRDDVTVS